MKFGVSVPNFGATADARATAALAADAEAAGWDGFFVWDHVHAAWRPGEDVADPWVLLTAVALATTRVTIGPLVTPLPRRRPWVVARQSVTLDRLSGGRTVLGVGLGFPPELEYTAFGEDPDDGVRAAKLDEGLEVLTKLWSGRPVSFSGAHYRLRDVVFRPTPAQSPRIPVWVGGTWPNRGPFRRAARWDGIVPIDATGVCPPPDVLAEIEAFVRERRVDERPLDVVAATSSAGSPADRDRAMAYERGGATWLVLGGDDPAALVRRGPPLG